MPTEPAAGQVVDNLLQVVAEFRNHGDLGAGGDGAHQGEVTLVATHHFNDETAVVGGGSGFNHVDEVDHGVQTGVCADAKLGVRNVVIDGAGQAKHPVAVAGERGGPGKRAVSAKDHQALDIFFSEDLDGLLLGRLFLKLEAATGGEDRAGVPDSTTNLHRIQRHELLVENTLIAVLDAHNLNAETDSGPDNGPDGGVHAGGVTSGSDDTNALQHGARTMDENPRRSESRGG